MTGRGPVTDETAPVTPPITRDEKGDRQGKGSDRRSPGQEKGLDKPKSGFEEVETGLTGGFQSIGRSYSGGSLTPLQVSLLASWCELDPNAPPKPPKGR